MSVDTKERMDVKPYYRVELADSNPGCNICGHGQFWTIVHGQGDDEAEVGTSWGDQETANDICDLMNMAYDEACDAQIDNAEEDKLVAFFRSPEGDALGRAGDYDNLSPAETAIRAMRLLSRLSVLEGALRQVQISVGHGDAKEIARAALASVQS